MIEPLVTLAIAIAVVGLILYALNLGLSLFPIQEPLKTVILILVVLAIASWLAQYFGVLWG